MTINSVAPAKSYEQFLRDKAIVATPRGIEVDRSTINQVLKFHQREMVAWMCRMGRAACFASFGIGKTIIQLEAVRQVRDRVGGMALIVAPLGVRGEFTRDAAMLGYPLTFIRSIEDAAGPGIYITNYETVREGKLDPGAFSVTSLDEAAILRGFGASKTFREFMRLFDGVPYKFIATATPSPNEYIELLAYSAYLEVMEVSEAKTRFFKRDSTKADKLTLHAHKAREFWLWVSSWALFVQKPSDIGGDDTGYDLPDLRIHWHEIPAEHENAGVDQVGQFRLFQEQAQGLSDAAKEKRDSLPRRVEKVCEILEESNDPQAVVWCDLNAEQDALARMMRGNDWSVSSLSGAQDIDVRETLMDQWRNRETRVFLSKPAMYGAGVNLQQCHTMIFSGIGFRFADVFQGIHRVHRYLQDHPVELHFVYTENERKIRETLERKWAQHREMSAQMTGIIREYGLDNLSRAEAMARAMGVDREEEKTEHYHVVHNDTVLECRSMVTDSVGLILTSIPFSTQYEYSPNYADFGHTDNNEHFFEQMDYLTPELLRILKPGRMAVIHVKDRIVPGGMTGLGFQTVYPFHARCIEHYTAHGFAYMGMKTIVTDVVRENNQTYRLGWTEQCRDATKMGVGMPEYLLLFRKPQTDNSRSYTDEPVTKDKPLVFLSDDDKGLPREQRATGQFRQGDKRPCVRGTGYSRARWQIDAHGFARSSGDRFPTTDEIRAMPHEAIFKAWRKYGLENIYEYEQHVGVGEDMEEDARLPVTFMLLQPPSWHQDVWTDVARMRCLNGEQQHKGKQMHLCLARGSLILTREHGYIPIETVSEGDHVLTHKGRWKPVLVVRNNGMQPVVTLRAQGVPGLTLTPGHKVWTRKVRDIPWAASHSKKDAEQSEPEWVEASQTIGSYINQKVPPMASSQVSDLDWWIVGRWIADGHMEKRGAAMISCAMDELAELAEGLGHRMGGQYKTDENCCQVRILDHDGSLKSILARCGKGAANKHFPPESFGLPVSSAKALLEGYLSGTGCFFEERHRWMATTVSKKIALGVSMLAQIAYGAVCSVFAGRKGGLSSIQGRSVNTRPEWIIHFDVPSEDRKKGLPFIMDDGAWKKVRSADASGEAEVWNLRVLDDESYTADGCIVKNCPMQYDIADRVIRQMSNKGDVVLDPFGGLMTVPYRAIKMDRYGVGVELSRSYYEDGRFYCRQAVSDRQQPTLFDFLDAVDEVDAELRIEDVA